jgi:formate hydrogenlyase transcriptional activator
LRGIPSGLVESELFGHERGAFTGAVACKMGKVELAAGGTLFLDEIGDLALESQTKLLRVLEEGFFERLGGTQTLRSDARIITATNRDLDRLVLAGEFRQDLYFRLRVFPVHLPPLRDRRDDIALLSMYFMEEMAAHLDKRITGISREAEDVLRHYHWPGNVRELEHVMKRAVVMCRNAEIRPEDIALTRDNADGGSDNERVTLHEHERGYVKRILDETRWTIAGPRGAAKILGIPESTLRFRMKKLGLRRS